MKKHILILLLLPTLVFGQENTISKTGFFNIQVTDSSGMKDRELPNSAWVKKYVNYYFLRRTELSSSTTTGALSSTDWTTFNNKVSFPGFGTSGSTAAYGNHNHTGVYQGVLSLTTTGTSGAATLIGGVLNIPQYSGGGGVAWGSITGDITDQTDLSNELNAKMELFPEIISVGDENYNISIGQGQIEGATYPANVTIWRINQEGNATMKFISQPWGADVTAASTITPTGPIFKLIFASVSTIQTINLPYTGFSGEIKIVSYNNGSISLGTSGNIASAVSLVQDRVYTLIYNPTDLKWYVSN